MQCFTCHKEIEFQKICPLCHREAIKYMYLGENKTPPQQIYKGRNFKYINMMDRQYEGSLNS